MNAGTTIIALALTYVSFFAFERMRPLRHPKAPLLARVRLNAALTAIALATAAVLVRPAALVGLAYSDVTTFGLLHITRLDGIPEAVAAFLLMDLTFYYWHIANHRIPFLWRMHNVHHIDPDLDVTTGFRFHFGEVALSAVFRLVQVFVIGPSLTAFAIYEMAFQTCTLFHHSNMRLGPGFERVLNDLLVTPRMHGIHHSDVRAETNSNFGVVFTCWDRLHRTLKLDVPQECINIGIPAYAHAADNRLSACLALPFLPQRDYWLDRDRRPARRVRAA